jgi:hypothetical protein
MNKEIIKSGKKSRGAKKNKILIYKNKRRGERIKEMKEKMIIYQ